MEHFFNNSIRIPLNHFDTRSVYMNSNERPSYIISSIRSDDNTYQNRPPVYEYNFHNPSSSVPNGFLTMKTSSKCPFNNGNYEQLEELFTRCPYFQKQQTYLQEHCPYFKKKGHVLNPNYKFNCIPNFGTVCVIEIPFFHPDYQANSEQMKTNYGDLPGYINGNPKTLAFYSNNLNNSFNLDFENNVREQLKLYINRLYERYSNVNNSSTSKQDVTDDNDDIVISDVDINSTN